MLGSVYTYTLNGLSVVAAAERVTQIETLPTSSAMSRVEFEGVTFTTTKTHTNV